MKRVMVIAIVTIAIAVGITYFITREEGIGDLPVYPGAAPLQHPDEIFVLENYPEVSLSAYGVDASVSEVMAWYRGEMKNWEKRQDLNAGVLYFLCYKKGNTGAIIMAENSAGVYGQPFFLMKGPWEEILNLASLPEELVSLEENHMLEIKNSFLNIQQAAQELSVGETNTFEVKLSVDQHPVYEHALVGGRIYLEDTVMYYQIRNLYSPTQTCLYENGAVILAQESENQVISYPSMVSVSELGDNNIEIRVRTIQIIGADEVAGTGTVQVELTVENIEENGPENVNEVSIQISSPYNSAWENYLLEMENQLSNYNPTCDLSQLLLTIKGKTQTEENDIVYFREVKKVRINIT